MHSYHLRNYTKGYDRPRGFVVAVASFTDPSLEQGTHTVVWYSSTSNDTAVRQNAVLLFADAFGLEVQPEALSYTLAA